MKTSLFKRGDLVTSNDNWSRGVFNDMLKTVEIVDSHCAVTVVDTCPTVPEGVRRHLDAGDRILEVVTNSGKRAMF